MPKSVKELGSGASCIAQVVCLFSNRNYSIIILWFSSFFSIQNTNRKRCYPTAEVIEQSPTFQPIKIDISMNNDDEMIPENTDAKIEQIFLQPESESESESMQQPDALSVQQPDALSSFFRSIERQTRDLPIHLQLLAKRKISAVIFDIEEQHISTK